MKRLIGFACLVLAIFLTPEAWDVLVNHSLQGQSSMTHVVHVAPAIIAWLLGAYLLERQGGSET
jgi:hypothetical protein